MKLLRNRLKNLYFIILAMIKEVLYKVDFPHKPGVMKASRAD